MMEGNVVTAAKWLGTLMILASLILVGGLRWVVSALPRGQSTSTTTAAAATTTGLQPVPVTSASAPNVLDLSLTAPNAPGDMHDLANAFHGVRPDQLPSQELAADGQTPSKPGESVQLPMKSPERFRFMDRPATLKP